MWNIKYETIRTHISEKLPDIFSEIPYLESDEGIIIKQVGSMIESQRYEYRGLWHDRDIFFVFHAARVRKNKSSPTDGYQVGLSSSILCLPVIDTLYSDGIIDLLKWVIKNLSESLLNFPKVESKFPGFPLRPISHIEFYLSSWKRWHEFRHIDFGEKVL